MTMISMLLAGHCENVAFISLFLNILLILFYLLDVTFLQRETFLRQHKFVNFDLMLEVVC